MEGYLQKWTNYILGWKRRYFILHNGVLHYCKERGSSERGLLHLDVAQVIPHESNPLRFRVDTGLTCMHMRAYNNSEAKQWIEAIRGMQREMRELPGIQTASSKLAMLHGKIGEMASIHTQIQSLIDLIPANLRESSSDLEHIVQLAQQIHHISGNTITVLHSEAQDFNNRPPPEPPETVLVRERSESIYEFEDAIAYSSEDEEEPQGEVVRHCLPVLRFPYSSGSCWEELKETIGGEFEKLQVPLFYKEPLSLLQKISEDLTYNALIMKAVESPELRLLYVTMFVISSLSMARLRAPFVPYVGETFELEQDGFQYFSEQVSPSTCCISVRHENYKYWGSLDLKSRFRGTHLEVIPSGLMHLTIGEDTFVWEKPVTVIQDLIRGPMYIEFFRNIEIKNTRNDDRALIRFCKSNACIKSSTEVTGEVFTDGKSFPVLGSWKDGVKIGDVDWKPIVPSVYNWGFSHFTIQLNLPPQCFPGLPKTDSRYRVDVRNLEEGKICPVNAPQNKSPKWFKCDGDDWTFNEKYWDLRNY